ARQLQPLAIILDILMPHKDGWQVLHELKTDVATRDIPVVLLSIVDQKDRAIAWEPSTTYSNRLTARPFWPRYDVSRQRIIASWWLMTTHTWWIWSANSSKTSRMRSRLPLTDRRLWRPWPSASLISFCWTFSCHTWTVLVC